MSRTIQPCRAGMARRPTCQFGFGFLRMQCILLLLTIIGCSAGQNPPKPQPNGPNAISRPPVTPPKPVGETEPLLPHQSLPAPFEELWIIEKQPAGPSAQAPGAPIRPGSGMLLTRSGQNLLVCPVQRTDVKADISGCIVTVDVSQRFTNPARETAEAIYIFPLPEGAAVSDFVMTVGQRHIRGIIREKQEAERIYHEAKEQGYLVSLLAQQEPNVFVQRVGNVAPGKAIDIELRYFHVLPYLNGYFTFSFPLVAGAREPNWPQPRDRDGRNISLSVRIDGGMPITRIESPTHRLDLKQADASHATATLAPSEWIANTDLVLRYSVAGDSIRSALCRQGSPSDGYFSLLLVPPASTAGLPRRPLDLALVIDASDAPSLRQAKRLAPVILGHLTPEDTFEVLQPGRAPEPYAATNENLAAGLAMVRSMTTDASRSLELLSRAFSAVPSPSRTKIVCLLSDAKSDARQILRTISSQHGSSHLLAVGLGWTPNRSLLDAAASIGSGAAVYLKPDDDGVPVFSELLDKLGHPALSDLSLKWTGNGAIDTLPRPPSELFVGRAVLITGQYHGAAPQGVTLAGTVGTDRREIFVRTTNLDPPAGPSAVASIWARLKLADLITRATIDDDRTLDAQIRQTALEHGLVSRYTSLICVDAKTQTAGSATASGDKP